MTTPAIMLAGTGSDVGKSLIVAGLCRLFARQGLKVAPFKPQNMSNNAAVTIDGGEIGRAQALQALAAGTAPSVHMNPVLLKPQSDLGSQVVVQGRVWRNAKARDYQALKPELMASVLQSFDTLSADVDLVIVEGAGSIAEVNLRTGDIANMGFATAANVPVVLVGDIDRGGVIAQIVGTHAVVSETDRAGVKGFIVNRFRGDPTLFDDGMALIAQRTDWEAMGLVPHFAGARDLPAEDAVALDHAPNARPAGSETLEIVVLCPPRISNFDDFDPLAMEPGVNLRFLRMGETIPGTADAVILPGSKATIADLAALRETGWEVDLNAHVRRGGHVLGICGGFQMLGRSLSDPNGIEGPPSTVTGLGLLDVATVLQGAKTLIEVQGTDAATGAPFQGYEMHVGETAGADCRHPMLITSDGRADGARDPGTGRIRGCYVHGVFTADAFRSAWLRELGGAASDLTYRSRVEATLDGLSQHLERHLDHRRLWALAADR